MKKTQKTLQWFNGMQPVAVPVAVGGGGVSGGVEQVSRMQPAIECHTFLYMSNLPNPE